MKVDYAPRGRNGKFLSRYPKAPGYPHFYVLAKDGALLHSQGTSELEEGSSYNLEAVLSFLGRWTPGALEGRRRTRTPTDHLPTPTGYVITSTHLRQSRLRCT